LEKTALSGWTWTYAVGERNRVHRGSVFARANGNRFQLVLLKIVETRKIDVQNSNFEIWQKKRKLKMSDVLVYQLVSTIFIQNSNFDEKQ
jgi:hypothetical protein